MSTTDILETLSGLWSLQRIIRITNTSTTPSQTFGPSPSGTILYHPSGYMSVIIVATQPSPEQIMSALSYSGPFKISVTSTDEGVVKGRVTHGPLIASVTPEMIPVGMVLERDFVISKEEGDGMVLRLSLEVGEGERKELEWTKVG